ncbi:MAG: glycosyltransferase family 39 protein, partial [Bacteroidota bacterium]
MESSASPHNRRVHFIVAGFALFNVLLHLIFYDQLGFHRDELLYFSYGKHPQLGYFAVPPLIGWLATILGHTIGFKLFAIRLLPALIGGGMMFLAAGIVREMGGKTFAKVLACTAVLCAPLFTRAWFLFQPVPFDIFFWTLIFYFLLRYVNDQQDITLYWLGLAVGLGLLNKYLVALPLTGLFLFLPFTSYRTLFRKRAFYLSLLIAFLVFLPNLFWQWQNDFPGLDHYAELNDTQLQFLSRWTLVLEQFLTYPSSLPPHNAPVSAIRL